MKCELKNKKCTNKKLKKYQQYGVNKTCIYKTFVEKLNLELKLTTLKLSIPSVLHRHLCVTWIRKSAKKEENERKEKTNYQLQRLKTNFIFFLFFASNLFFVSIFFFSKYFLASFKLTLFFWFWLKPQNLSKELTGNQVRSDDYFSLDKKEVSIFVEFLINTKLFHFNFNPFQGN